MPANVPITYNRRFRNRRLPLTCETQQVCEICGQHVPRIYLKQVIVDAGPRKGQKILVSVNHRGCNDFAGYQSNPGKPILPPLNQPPQFANEDVEG